MSNGLSLQWPSNPWAIAFLVILALLYGWFLLQARKRAMYVPALRIGSFVFALAIAALLLLTPLDTIGRTQLFFVHMIQVVALTTICTPLIMIGCTEELLHPLLDIPIVRGIVSTLTRPVVASVIFNLTFLLWHTPKLFALAQDSESLYHFMLLSIFLTSFLNWHPLIGSTHERQFKSYPAQMAYAFFDGQPVDILAFVLVFTQSTIYTSYVLPARLHFSAFSDQASGGAILLLPGIVDLAVMTPLFFRWLWQIESQTRLDDTRRQEELEEWEEEEDQDVVEGSDSLKAF